MSDTTTIATPAHAQTTVEPPGGPFIRHSEPGKARIYDLTSQSYSGLVNQPLTAIPGYASAFRLYFKSTATNTATQANSVVSAASTDVPFNVIQQIQVFDALGTPIYALPGYEAMFLVPMFSGGFGLGPLTSVMNLPSYSPITTGTAFAGQFTFASVIPLEFVKGIGVLGMADGSTLPKIQVQFNTASAVLGSTAPTITPAPVLEMRLNADFYWLPAGANVAPPGLGSTRQWFLQQGYPAIGGSSTTATVTIPRQGGWLDTMIFILRDSTGARQDNWPSIFRFKIDGIGEIETNLDEIYDDMAITWGIGATAGGTANNTANSTYNYPLRPQGVIALSRKTSLGRQVFGLLDTAEVSLSTSAGTAMTIEGAPWGSSSSNTPWTLNGLLGQIIPSGSLIQGLSQV